MASSGNEKTHAEGPAQLSFVEHRSDLGTDVASTEDLWTGALVTFEIYSGANNGAAGTEVEMQQVTDEYMLEMRAKTKTYTMMLLKDGPNLQSPDRDKIVWEHGRRNHALRLDGVLVIVCPVLDETGVQGLGIFNVDEEETRRILDGDPAVQAGIFIYEVHPIRGFPGDSLPA